MYIFISFSKLANHLLCTVLSKIKLFFSFSGWFEVFFCFCFFYTTAVSFWSKYLLISVNKVVFIKISYIIPTNHHENIPI